MRIDVYLNSDAQPFQSLTPPEKFALDTTSLPDGRHKLRFVAIDRDGVTSERVIRISVQNGPSIVVHGISEDDVVQGTINVLANAYSSRRGDEFEPMRIETPAPIPTWAWVLFLCIFGWGAGYLALELTSHSGVAVFDDQTTSKSEAPADPAKSDEGWAVLGAQVYGNTCSSCHQVNGAGLPGVFPSLIGNSVVRADDPKEHILAVLNGVSGKVIDGIAYVAPMPPFGGLLSNEEIAAVINHERSQWGDPATTISAGDVEAER